MNGCTGGGQLHLHGQCQAEALVEHAAFYSLNGRLENVGAWGVLQRQADTSLSKDDGQLVLRPRQRQ